MPAPLDGGVADSYLRWRVLNIAKRLEDNLFVFEKLFRGNCVNK